MLRTVMNNELSESDKHAYLIMAHHRPDLLNHLLIAVDDERNDIYLHVDSKSKDIVIKDLNTNHANLYVIEQEDVRWGGYSQVKCEYSLLKRATQNGSYKYYHLMTGATYPLKNQDKIHDFFNSHQGKEFVGFDEKNDFSFRAKFFFFMSENGKLYGVRGRLISKMREILLEVQRKFHVDTSKKYGLVIKKGMVYWSITDALARFIISKEEIVQKMLAHSISGDEIFVQTLVYNSPFYESIYDKAEEFRGAVRGFAWDEIYGYRPGHNFKMDDLETLLHSEWCFALKFEGEDGIELIESIKNHM